MVKVAAKHNYRFEPLLRGTQTFKCTQGTRYRAFASVAVLPFLAFSKKTYFNHRLLEKDGSLMCTTGSGMSPCTATHLTDLKQAYSRVNSELEQATTESDRRIHGTVNVYPQK